MRIEALTPEQESRLGEYRDKWVRIGLATGAADRPAVEAGIREAYRAGGLAPPQVILWLRSPLAGAVAAIMIAQVGDQVGDQVRDQVGAQVWDQVRDQVWAQVRDQVWAQVRAQVWAQVCYGQHDAGWLAFYDFFGACCGVEAVSRLSGMRAASGAGWWWPCQHVAIVTERPARLERDERGRLHCVDRAAIEYPDGWGVYAWHGVRVPREVICDPIQVAQIQGETNAEIRRVMLERYGLGRYLHDSGARVIDEGRDPSGRPIRLLRCELEGDEPLVMLEVIDATAAPDGERKRYMLRVDPFITSASVALAWTWDLPEADYRPVQET